MRLNALKILVYLAGYLTLLSLPANVVNYSISGSVAGGTISGIIGLDDSRTDSLAGTTITTLDQFQIGSDSSISITGGSYDGFSLQSIVHLENENDGESDLIIRGDVSAFPDSRPFIRINGYGTADGTDDVMQNTSIITGQSLQGSAFVVFDAGGAQFVGSATVTLTPLITAEDYASVQIIEASDIVIELPPEHFKSPGYQNALGNFFEQALEAINEGDIDEALNKLQKALDRTDGCIDNANGEPDGNGPERDWVLDCGAQEQLYILLTDAIDALIE